VYLIDGYNLLHRAAPGRANPAWRETLLARIEAWCRRTSHAARVVFDPTAGLRRREARGGVEVRVVAEGRTADDEIRKLLEGTSDRTAWTLVTNDLALVKAADQRGFRVVTCEAFLQLIAPPEKDPDKREGASESEVDFWLRDMGLEEEPGSGDPDTPGR